MTDLLTQTLEVVNNLPEITNKIASVIGYASLVASFTPWNWDNKAVRFIGVLVNALASNFGNAKNIAPKQRTKLND